MISAGVEAHRLVMHWSYFAFCHTKNFSVSVIPKGEKPASASISGNTGPEGFESLCGNSV